MKQKDKKGVDASVVNREKNIETLFKSKDSDYAKSSKIVKNSIDDGTDIMEV